LVRVKSTLSFLYFGFVGVMTTFTVFITFTTGSVTVIVRVCAYGNELTDMELVPVNRIIGGDYIVEESVFRFTHTVELDWMLPGLAPTGRSVEIAVVSIVKMDGEKLAHEHIYWDQASVLAQLGLLDADALPVVGAEAARKILDRQVPVNQLMKRLRAKGAKR